jgi:hypothetical protein
MKDFPGVGAANFPTAESENLLTKLDLSSLKQFLIV